MKRLLCILLTLLLLTGCGMVSDSSIPTVTTDPGEFTLTFITIGKGDCFLLTCPDGSHYLVDTGKGEDLIQISRLLRVKGIEQLDGIFITHGHHDHIGCLDLLTRIFPTKAVYYSGRDTISYTDILPEEIARKNGCQAISLEGSELLKLGGDVTAQVWLPSAIDPHKANNNSLILRLVHGQNAFLLMGDAELTEEALLMQSDFPLQAQLLKLGHHGKPDSTSPAFLDQVRPQIALIAGNAEEDPETVSSAVAASLSRRNITAVYSESDGLGIDFLSDGSKLSQKAVIDQALPISLDISFSLTSRSDQRVTLHNNGLVPADLSSCLLFSSRGDEAYLLPNGTLLSPGQELTIACTGHEEPGDLIWNDKKVWKKKNDNAMLFDQNFSLLAEDKA